MTISTINTCNAVKVAAQSKLPSLFAEIHDLDLIAKEFKYHRFCYSSFTFAFTDSTTVSVEKSKTMLKANFDTVKNFISWNVIQLRQVVSMTVVMKLHGGNQGKTYGGRLKEKSDSGVPRKVNVFSINLSLTRNSCQQRHHIRGKY